MTASSRPSANRAGAALVVVCCAADDAESLREALAALREDGLEVELVEGLEQDPKRLTEVIDRRAGEGLYVLCRSPRLGREMVEELREILLARHIPFARTLTVAVGGRGALADRIRSGLRRASTRTSGPSRAFGEAAPAGARGLRPTNAAEDEEPTLVGKRELGSPDADDGAPSRPVLPPARPRPVSITPAPTPVAVAPSPVAATPSEPIAEVSVVEMIDEDLLAEEASASLSGGALAAPDLDLSDLDQTGSTRMPRLDALADGMPRVDALADGVPRVETTAVGPAPVDTTKPGTPPPMITGNTVVGPAPVMLTGDTVVGERLPRQLRELAGRWPVPSGSTVPVPPEAAASSTAPPSMPETDPVTTPLPRAAPTPGPSLPPRSPSPEPSASFEAPAASAMHSAAPSPAASAMHGTTPSPAASASYGGSAAASAHGQPDEAAPAGRGALPWVLGVVALMLLALVIGLAVSSGDESSEVASNDAADDAATPTPTPSPEREVPADAEPEEPPPGPRVYRVVEALRARKVRALDVLLMATDLGKPSDYAAAAAYCQGLEVEGLRDWRLPHIGELSSLAEANMIARGMYWSTTAADTFGDEHMAWNVRRRHAEPHDDDAIAVCVRGGANGS